MIKILQSFKRIEVVLSVLFLLSCYSTHKSEESNIKIQISNIVKLSTDKYKDYEGTYYSIKIVITNNTDSVFRFWTMSCSWQDNWIGYSNKIYLLCNGCDNNYPIIKEIGRAQNITYDCEIVVLDTSRVMHGRDYRLGLCT